LLSLHERWKASQSAAHKHRQFRWICFQTPDAESLLADETVTWAHHPTNRSVRNLARNWMLARRLFADYRPDFVLSTGAGVAVPFLLEARRRSISTCYLELIARSEALSLTGRLLYGRTDHFLVQWPDLAEKFGKASYRGQVL